MFGKQLILLFVTSLSRPSLTENRESISHDGNVTTSLLKLNPQVSDDGSYLSCRAENLRLADSWLEDGWKLNVLCMCLSLNV